MNRESHCDNRFAIGRIIILYWEISDTADFREMISVQPATRSRARSPVFLLRELSARSPARRVRARRSALAYSTSRVMATMMRSPRMVAAISPL